MMYLFYFISKSLIIIIEFPKCISANAVVLNPPFLDVVLSIWSIWVYLKVFLKIYSLA